MDRLGLVSDFNVKVGLERIDPAAGQTFVIAA
jgi:hypothetical protein